MDPYIESCGLWDDFHQKLIGQIEAYLALTVPDKYVVRLAERTYVIMMSQEDSVHKYHMTQGDVTISLPANSQLGNREAVAVLDEPSIETHTKPIEMRALVEVPFREAYVEIQELHPDRKLVTTIEILSPANKRRDTAGWVRYQRKRQAHLEGCANLVEIDLLRGGQRMEMLDDWPNSPYYLLTCRRERAPVCTVWPAYYTVPIPEINVPLQPQDADIPLALQPMIATIYGRSRYQLDVDYSQACRPPLEQDGAEWLRRRLTEVQPPS
jgi:hypothetical protein